MNPIVKAIGDKGKTADQELILLLAMVRKLCPKNEEQIIQMILDEVADGRLPQNALLQIEKWRPYGFSIHLLPNNSDDIGLVISFEGEKDLRRRGR